jgi:peptidoglycan/xylan/chitin deacetylase (PgdA/CDA1 family)
MKTAVLLLTAALVFLFAPLVRAQSPALPTIARWPGDRKAAIALTFDDAIASDLDHAAPILEKHGIHGTFFVTTGNPVWRNRAAEWRRLAEEGNEIGGHTVSHPCLQQRIQEHSQDFSAPMMEAEIANSAQAILNLAGTRRGLTFAYPCGNIGFGPPADQARNVARYMDYVAQHFFAARIYGTIGVVYSDALNVLNVEDLGPTEGRDYVALLDMMQPALREGQAGVFTFHGVGGDYLKVSAEALDELAAYLERHSEIWTTTFGDLVRYIQESQALAIKPSASSDGAAQFLLSWPMDPVIFDLPLTAQWKLPAGWTSLRAEADDRQLLVRIVNGPQGPLALVDVPARSQKLRLLKGQ